MIGRRPLLAGMCMLLVAGAWRRAAAEDDARVDMSTVAAAYAALTSYSDTGTVEVTRHLPGADPVHETHGFETAFRAPRNFLFRFVGDPATGGDEFALWCDGGDFQSWWKAAGVHEVHGRGREALAFLRGAGPTRQAVNLIAPLLFPRVGVTGPATRPASLSLDARTGLIGRLELGDALESVIYSLDPVANPRGNRLGAFTRPA